MAPKYGFKDSRSTAELMLAPGHPESRVNISTGSLRLDIGGSVALPGVITNAMQMTGAIRELIGSAMAIGIEAKRLADSIKRTVKSFPMTPAAVAQIKFNVSSSGVQVGAGGSAITPFGLTEFSAVSPGKQLSAAYQNMLLARGEQLQAMAAMLMKNASEVVMGGVMITENYTKRRPYPLQKDVDMPTVSRLAVGGQAAQSDAILKDKSKFLVSGVPIAAGKPSIWSRLKSLADIKAMSNFNPVTNQLYKDRKSSSAWSEPPSAYAARAPYNNAQVTDAGHAFELDDTPGAERVHLFHRSGSFVEMHPNGTVVYKNMKDGYFITMNNQFIKVTGNCNIAVEGSTNLYSKKAINVQSDDDINFNAKKDFNVHAKNINLRAKQKAKLDGMKIDLRYMKLPTPFAIVNLGIAGPPEFVPKINFAAISADFPGNNLGQLAADVKMDPQLAAAAGNNISMGDTTVVATPAESPLSNPAVYSIQTPNAINYRARLFDTPEEVGDFEQYSAHLAAQTDLGDITGADPRELSGEVQTPDIAVASASVLPDYLDFETYKGNFEYGDYAALGDTSFVLRDLVDIALVPDVVTPLVPTPKPVLTVAQGGQGNPNDPTDPRRPFDPLTDEQPDDEVIYET